MKRFFVPLIVLAMLSGCATYEGTNQPVATQGVPTDPTYPGPGPHIGIGIGAGSWGRGGGIGFGLGW